MSDCNLCSEMYFLYVEVVWAHKPQTVTEAGIGENRNNLRSTNTKLPEAPGPALFRLRLVICVDPQILTH